MLVIVNSSLITNACIGESIPLGQDNLAFKWASENGNLANMILAEGWSKLLSTNTRVQDPIH